MLAAQDSTSLIYEHWKMKGMIFTLLINDLNILCGIHSTCIRTPAKGCVLVCQQEVNYLSFLIPALSSPAASLKNK